MNYFRSSLSKGLALSVLLSLHAAAQVNVLTYHNDNSRDGANLNESTLTLANVNPTTFGKLFSYPVDGYVYAQPLYVSGLKIGQATHNVIFVATEHNSVYAFDADSNAGANGGLLWHVNLGTSAVTPNSTLFFQAIQPEVGITGTPVIDPSSKTLYVDAFTTDGTSYFHHVHALNLLNGADRVTPMLVAASVQGVGAGSTNGVVNFQAIQQLQRSALTLANGVLYVCFAGFTDTPNADPYHGWVLGFSPKTLHLLPNYVFCTTPNGTVEQFGSIAGRGAVWMGGGGMAVDSKNNLYFATGDGNFTAFNNSGGTDYADTYLKLSTSGKLAVADYFTPYTQSFQQINDLDTGSGGVILLPDQPGPFPHLMVGAGKPSRAFVINRDMMTSDDQHINTNSESDNIVQTMPLGGGSFGTPAYFNEHIYYVASRDVIRSYALDNGNLVADLPNASGTRTYSFPGSTPSISANGNNNGIAWTIQNAQPSVLVAYNATNLSTELYSSDASGARDQLTGGVKFVVPTIANGKVYAGSQGALTVFGLIGSGTGGGFTPLAADYSGLFLESSGVEFDRSGSVNITTSKRGTYSGKVALGGKSVSFKGTFDSSGASATAASSKATGILNFSLQSASDNSAITGTVSGAGWSAELTANRELFNKKTNAAPFVGNYNLVFPGPHDADATHPQNDGTGTLSVTAAGQVKFKGVLGDGTKVSQSAIVAQDGSWPFYIPLYKQGGQIIGWLNFGDANSINGPTSWIKLANPRNKAFPDGFNLNPVATGSPR